MMVFYPVLVLLLSWPFFARAIPNTSGRRDVVTDAPVVITGQTMGTTYHITYFDGRGRNFKSSVDSLLKVVNQSINTYDGGSEVSIFNHSARGIGFGLPHFYPLLTKTRDVWQASEGAFDITVMPLVNAWGFGPGKALILNRGQIDSIRSFVGFNRVILRNDSVLKTDPRVQLDFGGIGQGYGADVIVDFLSAKGIRNMLVELGGEGVARGRNIGQNRAWQVGILDPGSTYDNQFFKAYVSLQDRSFTTAGNYFNFREIDGRKYSHTIDPHSGYPVDLPLLSVSVFGKDCMTADAWDTAFMVMGHTRTIAFLEAHPELDAILFYSLPDGSVATYVTAGIRPFVTLER